MSNSTEIAPRHGYRGGSSGEFSVGPKNPTVVISREAGARGSTIAESVGRMLGWQVFTQEMLDFLARDEAAQQELIQDVDPILKAWSNLSAQTFITNKSLPHTGDTAAVVRLMFALAARGDVVLTGRGAGFVLPAQSTIHVRIVAPNRERIAYFMQWQRLTSTEAAVEVANRDRRRAAFLGSISEQSIDDPTAYDMILNSARLGIEGCAEQIVTAVRSKCAPATEPTDMAIS